MYHVRKVGLGVEPVELAVDIEHRFEEAHHFWDSVDLVQMLLEEDEALEQELLDEDHELMQVELLTEYEVLGALLEELLAEGSEWTHEYFTSFSWASISRSGRCRLAMTSHE